MNIFKIITFDKDPTTSVGGAVMGQFHSRMSYGIVCSHLVVNCHLRNTCSRLWSFGRHYDKLVRGIVGGGESERGRWGEVEGTAYASALPGAIFTMCQLRHCRRRVIECDRS